MARIKLNYAISASLANLLGLREGREQFTNALDLDSGAVPVVVLNDTADVASSGGYTYGAAFCAESNIAANTNELVVAPAANVNGLIVHFAQIFSGNPASTTRTKLIAKAGAAPASGTDGDVLLTTGANIMTAVGVLSIASIRERDVFVAAGKGLYFRNASGTAENVGERVVHYTLLP